MSDNVPFNAQETPWDINFDYDMSQWIDPGLSDFNIPDDYDWSDAMDLVDWNAEVPDALGSFNAGPIRAPWTWTRSNDQVLSPANLHAATLRDTREGPMRLDDSRVKTLVSSDQTIPVTRASVSHCHPSDNSADIPSSVHIAKRTTDTATGPPLNSSKAGIKCHIQGCKHKGSFNGNYEFERHNQTIHGGESAKRFVCGAKGCFKGQLPWSFARVDKLTSHIKAMHSRDTTFETCPIADCGFGPSTLEVLGVHIQHAHLGIEEGRAVLNATPCKAVRCPLWRCGKHVNAKMLLGHVRDHPPSEVEAAMPSLKAEGLLVRYTPQHGITLLVSCPICSTVSMDLEHFAKHLMTDHLMTSGGSEHFEKWISYWARQVPASERARIQKLLPWFRIDRFATLDRMRDFQCPSCSFSVMNVGSYWGSEGQKGKQRSIVEHHLSLLRPEAEVVAELYPHRMAILRLCPEFVTHPVFADFDLPQEQSNDDLPGAQASYADQINGNFEVPQWTADHFGVFM